MLKKVICTTSFNSTNNFFLQKLKNHFRTHQKSHTMWLLLLIYEQVRCCIIFSGATYYVIFSDSCIRGYEVFVVDEKSHDLCEFVEYRRFFFKFQEFALIHIVIFLEDVACADKFWKFFFQIIFSHFEANVYSK